MSQEKSTRYLNFTLWVLQVLVAAPMLLGGILKLGQPVYKLAASYPWMGQVAPAFLRFIGLVDLSGGLGLLLPSLLRLRPIISAWAAAGVVVLMTCATVFHISRGEAGGIGLNIVLALLAAIVAWGRFRKAPLRSKDRDSMRNF